MNIFGFEIKSKEEWEQEEGKHLHRISPRGTARKVSVEQQLREKLPKEDEKAVIFYCILVKDAMTAGNDMSFKEAVGKVSKKQRILKLTLVMSEKVRKAMENNRQWLSSHGVYLGQKTSQGLHL